MIVFKLTKQNFSKNTFFTIKKTSLAKALFSFGYIYKIHKGVATVFWYDNGIKSELKFKVKELVSKYKSIYPYYNTKFIRGNIWKYSYLTLLKYVNKDTGFSFIKVDKITYKISPIKGNTVEICDAKYVLQHNIRDLSGTIINITNHDHPICYDIETSEGIFTMSRNSFSIVPQDYFVLLSIRCQ